VQYRETFNTAIFQQLKKDTSLTDKLGSYVIDSTTHHTIFSGQAPTEEELEAQGYTVNAYYPYLIIYAPLTPGAADQAFNASGDRKDVARSPSFQINVYEKTQFQVSKIQEIMDLVDNALSTELEEGLNLNPKNPSSGTPEWREDEGHFWVWMRFDCTILASEV